MSKPIIFFAHGNGFPSSCYRKLLVALKDEYHVKTLEMVGHDPRYPVTENWDNLVQELIDTIQIQSKRPVIAVGHSLGGILSIRASVYRPNLFEAVILLDSPMLGHVKSHLIRVIKQLGVIDKFTPADRTKRRREHWSTRDEAYAYLKTKSFFKNFDPDCLMDYVRYGLKKTENGYELKFNRDIEYQIYRTLPHILSRYRKKITVPTAMLYGLNSNVVSIGDVNGMRKHYAIECYPMKGGHMFPLEYPLDTAKKIKEIVAQLRMK